MTFLGDTTVGKLTMVNCDKCGGPTKYLGRWPSGNPDYPYMVEWRCLKCGGITARLSRKVTEG